MDTNGFRIERTRLFEPNSPPARALFGQSELPRLVILNKLGLDFIRPKIELDTYRSFLCGYLQPFDQWRK